MNITELFQDMAGNWRARVDLGDESIFLKFQNKPDNAKILLKAQKYLDDRAAQDLKDANKEAKRLALISNIESFDETTISKNDAITLVKKLIKNYYDPNGVTN